MSVQNLIQVMQAQTVLLNELAKLEKTLLSAILDKDAASIQGCIERNTTLSEHLNQAEAIRVTLIARMAAQCGIVSHPESSIQTVELYDRLLLRLPTVDCAHLRQSNKDFRLAIQNLVSINQALRMYTEAQLVTLDSFLCELLPQRTHGVYGANGRQTASQRPQLLNRQA